MIDITSVLPHLRDPLAFGRFFWPHVDFYARQQDIIYSTEHNTETVVVAANKVGKDFVAGFLAVRNFLYYPECRIITTSVRDDHLRVLWGEIGRFIQTSVIPLTKDKGGPLIVNHRDIRKLRTNGEPCEISYLRGMVSEKGEGMAGHHAAYTMLIVDEASGVDDVVYTQGMTWAKRLLAFGNANPCQNFFRKAVKGGDVRSAAV